MALKMRKNFTGITSVKLGSYLQRDYYQTIVNYIHDKTVLDVGCIDDGTQDANQVRLWNHWFIVNIAREVIGIDIRSEPIRQLKEMGFKVRIMDAQKIQFKNKFDVVFAGELIEHLSNPGLFLTSAARGLKKDGLIILSTPNPFSLNRLVRILQTLTNEPAVNPDHTLYLSPQNIRTLAHKCGLRVKRIDYAHFPFTKSSLLIKLNQLGCKLLGNKFKEQMMVFIETKS